MVTDTRRGPRASRNITLVLVGSATALAACAPTVQPTQRDHYLSVEDCAADWGRPEACEAASGAANATTGGAGTGGGYYFRGPMYSTGYRNDAQSAWRERARADGHKVQNLAPTDRSVARSSVSAPPTAGNSGRTSRGGFGSSSRSYSAGG